MLYIDICCEEDLGQHYYRSNTCKLLSFIFAFLPLPVPLLLKINTLSMSKMLVT